MTIVRLTLVLTFLFIISACTEYLPARLISDTQVQELIAKKKYSQAIKVQQRRIEDQPSASNKRLLDKIRSLANRYDTTVSARIRNLHARKQWKPAISLLNIAENNYAEGKAIRAAGLLLRADQRKRSEAIETRLLLARGNWLLEASIQKKKLAQLNPYGSQVQDAEQAEQEKKLVAEKLTAIGRKAMARKDYDLAERSLTLADRLQFSGETTRLMAKLAHTRYQERKRLERRRISQKNLKIKRQASQLGASIQQALRQGKLHKAQTLSNQLAAMNPDSGNYTRLIDRVNQRVRNRVIVLTNRGDELYSHGNIKGARQTWKSALRLSPGNTGLISRIDRAERVLSHLKELKRKQ